MNNIEIQSREWWAQRWIDLLETSRFKKRLERARNYARQGNVLNIEFQGANVLAKVQGTEPEPYQVNISLEQFTDELWDYVIETMSQRAIFSAQLLAGEMPQNIEEVFAANGLSLYPFTLSEVKSRCSCPDPQNPCKHIGAVYYLLGDRFSEDPFVLFQLRGRTKEQILDTLRRLRSADSTTSKGNEQTEKLATETSQSTPEVTPIKIEQFWEYNEPLDPSLVVITPSSDTVLDVLGSIPLHSSPATASGADASQAKLVMQYLDAVYKSVSQQAVLAAMNREE